MTEPNDTEPAGPPDSSVPPPKPDQADIPTEPDANPEPFPLPDGVEMPAPLIPEEDPPPLQLNIYTGDEASLTRDKRPWLDYGKDTGPRLRVIGLADRPGPPPPNPEELGEWAETHERYKKARAEGDDHAIAQIMEPVLDALHTETPAPPVPELDWTEMEPALIAELSEWGRAVGVRRRNLALKRFFGDNICVRVVFGKFEQDSAIYEARVDGLRCRQEWKKAKGNARAAASSLTHGIAREFMTARARDCVTVPDPELLH